jgi:hypothetical protein
MAVMCGGLSLSDCKSKQLASCAIICLRECCLFVAVANMAKIVELRCVDALLKLVRTPNPNPCAVLQTLSLAAEEDPSLFQKTGRSSILDIVKTGRS